MSVDRPPKLLVWKDRPKSRKVSKIRTVSTIHRTTRLESPTEDTTNDAAPQSNVSDTAAAVDEEQAPLKPTSEPPPETSIPAQAVQPPLPSRKRTKLPLPHGSGLSGFPARNGTAQTLRNRTSITISCDQRPHQILVGHSQFPNTKIATHRPSRPVTLSSQETSMMTSPPGKTESNQAQAR
jgi:hypothetical protein